MPILIKYAAYLGMLDKPDVRKIHQQAIPRCGGIAIAFGAFLAILFLVKDNRLCYSLMAGGLIIIVFGFLDDIFNLHYKWKFLGQLIATLVVISQGIYLHELPFMGIEDAPWWISYPLTALFVIGVTNAVNLADGLDGLAAGVMLLTLAFIAIFSVNAGGMDVAVMALAISGGLIGFLKYNTYPAIVFMGDLGSQLIGFMAVNLSILLTQDVNQAMNPALPVLILGLPILDTLSVMVLRISSGLSPFAPDNRHIHHKLMHYGLKHPQAVAIIYILQSIFLLAATFLKYAPDWQVIGFYSLISCGVLGGFFIAGKVQWTFPVQEQQKERRNNRFLSSPWIFITARYYIDWSICLFLSLLTITVIYGLEISYQFEALLIGISYLLYCFIPNKYQDWIIRCSIYMGSVFITYIQVIIPVDQLLINEGFNIFLVLLFLVTCLATRVTRKCYFILNTQDLLVLLFILVAMLSIKIEYLTRSIAYLFCLGYALEYLLQRDIYKFKLIRILAILNMLNILLFIAVSY